MECAFSWTVHTGHFTGISYMHVIINVALLLKAATSTNTSMDQVYMLHNPKPIADYSN